MFSILDIQVSIGDTPAQVANQEFSKKRFYSSSSTFLIQQMARPFQELKTAVNNPFENPRFPFT
jgi:hypothetical protein